LITTKPNDIDLLNNTRNGVNPNFGFGVYYHNPKFFVGLSSPRLIEQSIDGSPNNLEKRHYFGIIGGIVNITPDWKLRPTTQIKTTIGAPISIDMSLTGIYQDRFWFGSMYRLMDAIGVFAQFQVNQQFRVGLASDFSTSKIRSYNVGTFELLMTYDFVFNKNGIRSPRYF
jgi:type IX secretion system PorP/SprF family membrane protein